MPDYTWEIDDLTDAERWLTGLLVFPVGDPAPPPVGPPQGGQVIIPMHVTTRVLFPTVWGEDCLCDE